MEKTRKKRKVRRWVRRLGKLIMFAVVACLIVTAVIYTINHWECVSEGSRYSFMLSLDSGNEEALEHYQKDYIDQHIYLFNGDLTLRMMAEQHNVDYELFKAFYESTELENLQQFYDEYIKGNEDIVTLIASAAEYAAN